MKMRIKIAFAVLATFCCFTTAQAESWYEGGTLHKATVKQFRASEYENARATAADWLAASISDKEIGKLNELNWKHASENLVMCIIKATDGVEAVQNNSVTDVAVMCMAQLKKDYPWIMTKY